MSVFKVLLLLAACLGIVCSESLQPFWLPFSDAMLDGIVHRKRGDAGVLVLPIPVPMSNDDAEPEPERWATPARDEGGRRRPFESLRRTPPRTATVLRDSPVQVVPPLETHLDLSFETEVEPQQRATPARGVGRRLRPPKPLHNPTPTNATDLPDNPVQVAPPIESSKELVKQFRKQIESIPYEYDEQNAESVLEGVVRRRRGVDTPPPAPLTFPRPLTLRGELYVRYARYKEPFTVWESADGGAVTTLRDGTATAYRVPQPDGQMKLKLIQVDKSLGKTEWKCWETAPFSAGSDKVLQRNPALPDVSQFEFTKYVQLGSMVAEEWRWQRTGGPGELAAAPGEALTFRHEMLVTRLDNKTAIPFKYTVRVDSSVLGPQSDGYEVRYKQVTSRAPPALDLDPSRCDSVTPLTSTAADDLALLEPLREFTRPDRDPRYDAIQAKFKSENSRKYKDSKEEAVRKNLVMTSSRYVTSTNRAGESFAVALNYLGDRLDAELARMYGVQIDLSKLPAEPFPYSADELKELAKDLPPVFDWRQHNGVTPVRQQGLCESCWAISVTGAVEGARFIRTKLLQPLAEQALVDCAHTYGGNGCKGTWPVHAYEYMVDRGLPAAAHYGPYVAQKKDCRDKDRALPGTRISGFVKLEPENIDAVKVAIRLHAPVVVIIDSRAPAFAKYDHGVFNITDCQQNKQGLTHAMLAVGWNNTNDQNSLIVKNSWDTKWGLEGYMEIQMSGNTCGVLTYTSYPVLDEHDVLNSI